MLGSRLPINSQMVNPASIIYISQTPPVIFPEGFGLVKEFSSVCFGQVFHSSYIIVLASVICGMDGRQGFWLILCTISLLIHQSSAIECPIPTETGPGYHGQYEGRWTPKIYGHPNPIRTTAPVLHQQHRKRKNRIRQMVTESTIGYVAPDNVCGYQFGNIDSAFTCPSEDICAVGIFTDSDLNAIDPTIGLVACCNTDKCDFVKHCVESTEYFDDQVCDKTCKSDPEIKLCTSSGQEYCHPYLLPSLDVTLWGCASTSFPSDRAPIHLRMTYKGENEPRSWAAVVQTITQDITTSQPTLTTTSNAGPAVKTVTKTLPEAFGEDFQTKIASKIVAYVQSYLQTPSATPTQTPQPTAKHTGIIIGAAVSGFTVFVLVVLGIIWLVIRERRRRASELEADQQDLPALQPPLGLDAKENFDRPLTVYSLPPIELGERVSPDTVHELVHEMPGSPMDAPHPR